MEKLEKIAEQIRQTFDTQTVARDQALTSARALTRACALSIRAVHRDETDVMQAHLDEARQLADRLTGPTWRISPPCSMPVTRRIP